MVQTGPASSPIIVHVRPIGLVRKFADDQDIWMKEGATPKDVIRSLRIPDRLKMVGFINGNRARLDDQLQDGDNLKLVTLATGG